MEQLDIVRHQKDDLATHLAADAVPAGLLEDHGFAHALGENRADKIARHPERRQAIDRPAQCPPARAARTVITHGVGHAVGLVRLHASGTVCAKARGVVVQAHSCTLMRSMMCSMAAA